ncbi:hypothetical protein [Kitasatospora sp. NPDC094016]|uniref:hypothetical protein n=1 Tax=Kitasatospora sp. NPDC094016 TaxID=3154986 RepID=UPI00331B6FB6
MGDTAPGGGFEVDPDVVFRASVQFLGSKDFVYNIASGVVGDLASSEGMAGDDTVAHDFATKYERTAKSVVKATGTAGRAMATISSRLLTMAANYLSVQDSVAAASTGKINTLAPLAKGTQQCDESEAHNSLPMVTGSREAHEIPVIGKFWPQGNPNRLRGAAQVWEQCASAIDTAQRRPACRGRDGEVHRHGVRGLQVVRRDGVRRLPARRDRRVGIATADGEHLLGVPGTAVPVRRRVAAPSRFLPLRSRSVVGGKIRTA